MAFRNGGISLYWFTETEYEDEAEQKQAVQGITRLLGGKWDKGGHGDTFRLQQDRDGIRLSVNTSREAVCERVVTGTRQVTVPAIEASPERVETVEDVEWGLRLRTGRGGRLVSAPNVSVGSREVALGGQILRTLCGSDVYAMATEGTDDRDAMGVFIEPADAVLGIRSDQTDHYVSRTQPQGARSGPGDVDITLYSLRKYMRLATAGNPTVLTVLYAPQSAVLVSTDLRGHPAHPGPADRLQAGLTAVPGLPRRAAGPNGR